MTAPAGLSNQSIADYALMVGEHYNVYDDRGTLDMPKLLAALGGKVELRDGAESSHVFQPGAFVAYVPHNTSARRDRFTIAHEIGHYFLHYVLPKREGAMQFGRGGRDRAETEANVFASALLMPAEKFRELYAAVDGDSWRLAAHFDVSPNAAAVRAQVLGLA